MEKFVDLARKPADLLITFKKWREGHPLIVLGLWSATCFGAGATVHEMSLPWRGKMVIEAASHSPSLSARGLWDNDHPSPKAIELARVTPNAGPDAIKVLMDRSVSMARRASLVEITADYAESRPRCEDFSKATKEAFHKIDGMWGGATYTADRDQYRESRRREVECWTAVEIMEKEMNRLVGRA